jgi:F420-0:gamma-glutamyl ligase-like protein
MSTPTKERAEQLANMVEKRRQAIESMLMDIKEQRGEDAQLEPGEQARYRQMTEDLRSLQDHAETYAEDLARVGTLPTKLAHSGGADAHARNWAANTATELRRAFGAESRAVISGSMDVPLLIPEYVTAIPHPVPAD